MISEMSQRSKSNYWLIGIPDHQGVIHVGGRIGQAEGPGAMRRVYHRMAGPSGVSAQLKDVGDVEALGLEVSANHRSAAEAIRDLHLKPGGKNVTVVIGGGHDHGYSQLLGVRDALGSRCRIGCINIDPHLDVRKPAPTPTSGSPFYLALESGVLHPARFVEFGTQSHCNAKELWNYIGAKKAAVVPFSRLRGGKAVAAFKRELAKLASRCDAIVVSMDLDAVAEAYAPGVSAPQAEGFTASEMIQMAELAGASSKVVSLGIFELNPAHDIGDRTARLAATATWHFVESRLTIRGRG
jgi:formiminoglutamase